MRNEIERREALEKREHELHEQLAENTRRLQSARAQARFYEEALESTLSELHHVREERDKLTQLIEGMWNGDISNRQQAARL